MTGRGMKFLRLLGSHGATLWLMAAAGAVVLAGLFAGIEIADWIWLPGIGLLVNLLAALIGYPSLRTQPWLFAVHALIGVMVVVAMADALTHLKGRVELTEGASFTPGAVEYEAGLLHPMALDRIDFVQAGFEIRYAPGMKRRETSSTVLMPDGAGGWQPRRVGDETPLIVAGYRFYTTFNKGFAPILSWTDSAGRQITGSVHMPSYPLFSHRQANDWTPPGGDRAISLWLSFAEPVYDEANDWTFAKPENPELIVIDGDARHPLSPGESVALRGGRISFDGLRVWMGYTVTSSSLAPWLMALALVAGACLAIHLWTRLVPVPAVRDGEMQHG